MHIGINASAVSRVKGGASVYIVQVTRRLAAIDPATHYTVFCTPAGFSEFTNLPANVQVRCSAPGNVFVRLLWELFVLPVVCFRSSILILFCPNYISPLYKLGFKTVVTIHDLSFFPLSGLYPLSRRLFKPIIKWSVKRADRIIAVSQFTAKDIVRYIGDYQYKTTVIYNGVDERFFAPVEKSAVEQIRNKYAIRNRYILFTGFLEPRKNLARLIEAYAGMQSQIHAQLVIAGGNGWWYKQTYEYVSKLGIADSVTFTGYVPDSDLPALYAGAYLFAFPSLYEGFGIAAAEAIACGTPVLASNNTSLPEVVKTYGIFVDPYSVGSIKAALQTAFDPAWRDSLQRNFMNDRIRFSWDECARQVHALCREGL